MRICGNDKGLLDKGRKRGDVHGDVLGPSLSLQRHTLA